MLKLWRLIFFSILGALVLLNIEKITENRSIAELNYILKPSEKIRKQVLDRIKRRHLNTTKQIYSNVKLKRTPQDLKFILKWTKSYKYQADAHFEGQDSFLRNRCKHKNCYLTHDKNLLVNHIYFDAIIFTAEENWNMPPYFRSFHQKYIFAASSSDSHHLFCHPFYDSFYNLTWTFKLDSDIRWSTITIEDTAGNIVGPKTEMKWVDPMLPTPRKILNRIAQKKRAVAWHPLSCKTSSKREKVAKAISQELEKYELNVDTYGWCGSMNCPKDLAENCLKLLEDEYYFYFAFENNLVVDYVSAQLLNAVQHLAVPVVFGGANYSSVLTKSMGKCSYKKCKNHSSKLLKKDGISYFQFLPPGSYIDASKSNASVVASLMYEAINNQDVYRNYFRWHNHYVYKTTPSKDVCKLCELLNDPSKEHSELPHFRDWWHDYDPDLCMEQLDMYDKNEHMNMMHQL